MLSIVMERRFPNFRSLPSLPRARARTHTHTHAARHLPETHTGWLCRSLAGGGSSLLGFTLPGLACTAAASCQADS